MDGGGEEREGGRHVVDVVTPESYFKWKAEREREREREREEVVSHPPGHLG